MFNDAQSLISLDLYSFNTSLLESMTFAFYNCKSLIFINLNSFVENGFIGLEHIFSSDAINLTYCIDKEKSGKIYEAIKKISIHNDCNNICFSKTKKLIKEKKICIDDCNNDDTYKYEFNNIYYDSIQQQSNKTIISENSEEDEKLNTQDIVNIEISQKPQNTEILIEKNEKSEITEKSLENDEISNKIENNVKTDFIEITVMKEKNEYIEDKETIKNKETESEISINVKNIEDKNENNIIENFSSEDFFKQKQYINKDNLSEKDKIIQSIKGDLINGKLNNLLMNVTSGEKQDLITTDNNTIYQITTSENQNNNEYTNISTINLGDCENRLKQIYGINQNISLLIFKIDYYETGLLIPIIGYEIYHPIKKFQLDLNYCNDILVKLNIPVSIDENKLFKHDPNSEYYTDECYSYTTENGTDIILEDRKNEYKDNNLSLCEFNCIYKGYNENTKKALCECQTKPKID